MKKYQVQSKENEPLTLVLGTEVLGTLYYPNGYSTTRAEIQIKGQDLKMQLITPGFWKNNLELWKGTDCLGTSKLGWNLCVTVRFQDTNYLLKVKDLSKGVFTLQDETNGELLRIAVTKSWIQKQAEFELDVLKNEELFAPEILLFLVHNCNYFLARMGDGGSTEGMLAAIL